MNSNDRVRCFVRSRNRAQRGASLIELMVACVLGLLVMAAVINVMLVVSASSRTMQAGARIQENARFALSDITRRLRTSTEMACLAYTGRGSFPSSASAEITEAHRSINVIFDASGGDLRIGAGEKNSTYAVDAASFIRGFECTTDANCSPQLDALPAMNVMGVPAVGLADGLRANGSDVLFVSQLKGKGARIVAQSGEAVGDGFSARVTLGVPASEIGMNEPGPVLLTDCSSAVLAMAAPSGSDLVLVDNFTDDVLPGFETSAQARAYSFDPDEGASSLDRVAYYVGLRSVPDGSGGTRLISSLMRSSRGELSVVIDGVERFDLLYHAEDDRGFVSVLRADEVDALVGCRSVDGSSAEVVEDSGPCGWRSLVGVEMHMLVNSVDAVDVEANQAGFSYPWNNAGAPQEPASMEQADSLETLLSGLKPNRERRSHFSTFVSLRAKNP